jgi:hypothetical protein
VSRTGIESSEVEVVAVDALNGTAFPILCRSSRAAIESSFCTPPGSISPQPSAPRPSPRLRCQRKANAKCRPPRPSRYPRWLGALPWTNRPADFLDNSTLYDVGTIGRPFRCVNLDLMHQANHTRCTIMKHARRHIRCACCAEGGQRLRIMSCHARCIRPPSRAPQCRGSPYPPALNAMRAWWTTKRISGT